MKTTNTTSPHHNLLLLHHGGLHLFPDLHLLELVLALIVYITIHSLRQKRTRGLPTWPVLSMIPSLLLALRGDVYEWVTDVLRQQNGSFTFEGPWFSNKRWLITTDPRNLEHILKTKFANFPKGNYFRSLVHDLLGDGIFAADDEVWMQQRKTASIEFHSTKFRRLTVDSLLDLVHHRLLPVLEDCANRAAELDLQDVLLRLTFDNVCIIAFGVDPGCLRPGLPDVPFARAFEDATGGTIQRFVSSPWLWKAMRYLNIGNERKLKESIQRVDEFANGVIRTRKVEIRLEDDKEKENDSTSTKTTAKRSDLLTVFMRLRDEKGNPFSDKYLRDICVNFILAGRDTSSVALCWFFWLLDKHPAVEERILAEICGIVREREDVVGDDDLETVYFKAEEVKRMEYLQAAISEALRLYPSVPVDFKQVSKDDILPDGRVLKKGDSVLYSIYSMGRMEAIWGKDCRGYRPERWLRDGRFISQSAYKFTAFNGGPRLCLGKDFSYYQMKYVASTVIYRYRVKVVRDHPIIPKLALTMYMKYGLKVNIFRRDQRQLQKYLDIK